MPSKKFALFVQAMLSKVDGTYTMYNDYYVNNNLSEYYGSTSKTLYSTSEKIPENTKLEISLKVTSDNWQLYVVNGSSDTTPIKDDNNTNISCVQPQTPEYDGIYTIPSWGKYLYLKLYSAINNKTVTWRASIRGIIMQIEKTISTRKSLPRELKAIGEKATATLFGYHTDNTRYTGE